MIFFPINAPSLTDVRWKSGWCFLSGNFRQCWQFDLKQKRGRYSIEEVFFSRPSRKTRREREKRARARIQTRNTFQFSLSCFDIQLENRHVELTRQRRPFSLFLFSLFSFLWCRTNAKEFDVRASARACMCDRLGMLLFLVDLILSIDS